MKKAIWTLGALALTGFGMYACGSDDCDDPCEGATPYCIQNADEDYVCSACPTDCEGQGLVCINAAKSAKGIPFCYESDKCSENPQTAGMLLDTDGSCVSATKQDACTSDTQCEIGEYCDDDLKRCVEGEREVGSTGYKYVRIDDLSALCTKEGGKCKDEDPGADIDAVALVKGDGSVSYATSFIAYSRADGQSSVKDKLIAADPEAALGAPDSIDSYANGSSDGTCYYYKADCEAKGADKGTCDYTFVSLGGQGGYIELEMASEIEAGDKIDVLEVGDCTLKNTRSGSADKAKIESIKVQISVTGDDGTWKVVGEQSATKGIVSLNVSSALFAD